MLILAFVIFIDTASASGAQHAPGSTEMSVQAYLGGTQASQASGQTVAAVANAASANPVALVSLLGAAISLTILFYLKVLRPGGLGKGRSLQEMPGLIFIAAAGIVFILQTVAAAAVYSSLPLLGRGSAKAQFFVVLSGYGAATASLAVLASLIQRLSPDSGLKPNFAGVTWGIVGFLIAAPIVNTASLGAQVLYRAVEGSDPPAIAHGTLQKFADDPHNVYVLGQIILAVILAPIVEEYVYRGFVQSALLRWFGRPWIAVVLSSVVFTLMHALPGTSVAWPALIPLFVLSLSMGAAFEKTRNLATPIIMHVLFNAANVLLVMYK